MALNKCILGTFLELRCEVNSNLKYGIDDVRGVNNLKQLMPTKADLNGRDLSKFQIVNPGDFVFNHRTSRNGSKFSIAVNDGNTPIICTEDYVVFKIKDDCKNDLSTRWLYMYFCRSEFDRFVITNSWGSSTEFYNWDDIRSLEINIPSIDIQQKYVDIYNAMLANQKSYERGLDDLKLVCDAYIENLRREIPCEAIGSYIQLIETANDNLQYTLNDVKGISIQKKFIETKADMAGVSLKPYKIVAPNNFAYVTVTSRNGEKITLALNNSSNTYIVSSSYLVFKVLDAKRLSPDYLFAYFTQPEFDRYARYHSWGSARETFDWDEMCNVQIPIPKLEVQQYIVNILKVLNTRKEINEKLKTQIKDICPILIKGSIEEVKKSTEK